MGFVPLEDHDCEVNIGHRQAGECIVRRGPACLRDAAIRWKTAFFPIVFVLFRWFTQMHNAAAKD